MASTGKEIYDLANDYYLNSIIQVVEDDPTYKVYEVYFNGDTYKFCICDHRNSYQGNFRKFFFNDHSEKLAKNLCWKKLIEPNL